MSSLYQKLASADLVCKDCGKKYGRYSVGCSSFWVGTCDVCGEEKSVTEVRDFGYLGKGLQELRENIKEQSKQVAEYIKSQEPILTEGELDEALTASYERGEITLKLTEEEVGFLNECLDTIAEKHPSVSGHNADELKTEDVRLFESIEKKITDLYDDYCVRYSLSPALKKFHELYGTFGTENEQEQAKWVVFRDAFHAGADYAKEAE
jgi:hypothetical protein